MKTNGSRDDRMHESGEGFEHETFYLWTADELRVAVLCELLLVNNTNMV